MLTLSDRGQGISAEDLPHLCDPFYRSAEASRLGRPGVGLGLTVAGRIVKILGGELRIDSEPGHGSRFSVYLPAVSETFARALLDPASETPGPQAESVDSSNFGPLPGIAQNGGSGVDRAITEPSRVGRGSR